MRTKNIFLIFLTCSVLCVSAQNKFSNVKVTNSVIEIKTNQLDELKDFDWEGVAIERAQVADSEKVLKLGFELKGIANKELGKVLKSAFPSKSEELKVSQHVRHGMFSKRPKRFGFSVEGKAKDIGEMISIITSVINKIE